MRERGIELTFVSSSGAEQQAFAAREGADVYAVEMSRRITPVRDCLALVRLVRLFKRLDPSIVHAHTPKAGLLAMLAARLGRVQTRIYHLHGLPYESASGVRRAVQMVCERVA